MNYFNQKLTFPFNFCPSLTVYMGHRQWTDIPAACIPAASNDVVCRCLSLLCIICLHVNAKCMCAERLLVLNADCADLLCTTCERYGRYHDITELILSQHY